ncbi:GH1 family beta-glucosidase [Dyadobacter crusticola]|uniref:GH1 family beta-glucosidase n=1 Tax=Dyadobacter crusticola TaxID=292407 RepID=UPI000B2B9E0A|nr:GH1 family beta-glucosidase [Dyadobacter crusticola]
MDSVNSFFKSPEDTIGQPVTLSRSDFGADFRWGVATAAYQIEGAVNEDGRKDCIWDTFSRKKGRIKNGDHAQIACDFYHHYEKDLLLVKELGFTDFRFSISWSRVLPLGRGEINEKGIAFYNRLIDQCIALGLTPWITLYHWDLPQALEDLGGWTNRQIVDWFSDYAVICAKAFGDRVKNWIILNEPMAVAGLGYTTGLHAPGKKGIWNFLPAVHHLALCQAEGGRRVRELVPNAFIGTSVSCSYVYAESGNAVDIRAAKRADAVMNKLFVEPALGLGYPVKDFPFLSNLNRYMREGDLEKLRFDFDFLGVQNYFSVVVKHSWLAPVVWLKEVPAKLRNVPVTSMGWEVDPDGMYKILKQYAAYEGIKEIIVSESGAAFEDHYKDGKVADPKRRQYFEDYLAAILKAKNEGVNVSGYLAWTLMDNFEWAEGYAARFGLVFVDFKTQKRTIKESGFWFKSFLNE